VGCGLGKDGRKMALTGIWRKCVKRGGGGKSGKVVRLLTFLSYFEKGGAIEVSFDFRWGFEDRVSEEVIGPLTNRAQHWSRTLVLYLEKKPQASNPIQYWLRAAIDRMVPPITEALKSVIGRWKIRTGIRIFETESEGKHVLYRVYRTPLKHC